MPVPAPPRMKLGRMMIGQPISWATTRASSTLWAKPDCGYGQSDVGHRFFEALAIFGRLDRLGPRADHFHAEALEVAAAHQLHREVERGLAPEGGQQGVGALALDDVDQHVGVQGLDVRGVRRRRVGHDRGGVGVDQHDAVPLGPQHLAGLGPGVVELTGLTDHDRSRADHHDRRDVIATRH